ncbi:hypothetical protein HBH53_249290 [Parastagonospora nodorum]|nr:hypothetical protein HBH53_249290 [Parastagonospora nodorum]KAH4215554.1 hypothetical protein HBI06_247120 [Parastagonospora nodorum]KAH5555344.1 hypothetical protein HBI26_227530 [Parastagonospora nodorum]KAH5724962.1 hypothetical protein HBI17_243340 [Parastagonospora nodorum]KAH5993989.1 hypothetical protein HBI83_246400 [Parastagonospora nodorum]
MYSNRTRMRVEVFKLGKRQIVVRPASRANLDNPVAREVVEPLRGYLAHQEARLVKVIHVLVCDPILLLHTLNQCEPGLDNRWVLAGSSLAIIWTAPACSQLRSTLNKVINPVLANRLASALSEQSISHISHVSL